MDKRRNLTLGRIHRIHMVGIGGIGMSSIAEVLLVRGFDVSGSDLVRSEATERLESVGATVFEGHDASNVGNADLVVHSSAVNADENPETLEAARRRIPIIPRAVMLGELMRMKYGIGIAGTHGKTTTTSMAGLVVAEGGFDPTIIVGGKVSVFGTNAVAGEGDVIVIEADEYDRTFLRLTPTLAVVTNIEEEHLDTYRDLDDLLDSFARYAGSVPFFGAAICCLDDPNVQSILERIDRRIVTYGFSRQAAVRADNVRQDELFMVFDVLQEGERLGEIRLAIPGRHNVLNALAAVAIGLELEIPFDLIQSGIARFSGVHRRLHTLGTEGGVLVVDDYAHHPTEIRATLETANRTWPDRRIVAVFQPHLYSRTRDFMDEFARSFFDADLLISTAVYGAREEPLDGVQGDRIVDRARALGHRGAHYIPDRKELAKRVVSLVRSGDVVIALGAGDIWRFSRELMEMLAGTKGGGDAQ